MNCRTSVGSPFGRAHRNLCSSAHITETSFLCNRTSANSLATGRNGPKLLEFESTTTKNNQSHNNDSSKPNKKEERGWANQMRQNTCIMLHRALNDLPPGKFFTGTNASGATLRSFSDDCTVTVVDVRVTSHVSRVTRCLHALHRTMSTWTGGRQELHRYVYLGTSALHELHDTVSTWKPPLCKICIGMCHTARWSARVTWHLVHNYTPQCKSYKGVCYL